MDEVQVKTRSASRIAYIEFTGPYSELPFEVYMRQLHRWAKDQRVVPGFMPIGIYLDNPVETEPAKCRCQIAITFDGDAKASGEIKIKGLPEMQVAEISHEGPPQEISDTYQKLRAWILASGYDWAGPAIETYTKKPTIVEDEIVLYMQVQVPIRKK